MLYDWNLSQIQCLELAPICDFDSQKYFVGDFSFYYLYDILKQALKWDNQLWRFKNNDVGINYAGLGDDDVLYLSKKTWGFIFFIF